MSDTSSNQPVTTLAPVDLELPPLKAKKVSPILKDLAQKLKELTGQPQAAAELERIADALDNIKHGQKLHARVVTHVDCARMAPIATDRVSSSVGTRDAG